MLGHQAIRVPRHEHTVKGNQSAQQSVLSKLGGYCSDACRYGSAA